MQTTSSALGKLRRLMRSILVFVAKVAHSYADPATGAVHLFLRGSDPAFMELVADARTRKADYKSNLYRYVWRAHSSLLAHEWAHILQVVSYPFLFLRAARAGRVMIGPSVFLASNPGRHTLPLSLEMDNRWRESLMLSTVAFRAIFGERSVEFSLVEPGRIARGVLTELDMLEEDATVFQYRAGISAPGKGAAYRVWLRERPRYSRLFAILSQRLGDGDALRWLPILVRLAYHTTRPVEAFFTSLSTLLLDGPDIYGDADITDIVEQALFDNLKRSLGTLAADQLTIHRSELDDPPGVITPEVFRELAQRYTQLPVAPLTSLNHNGTDAQRGVVDEALRAPWRFFDRRQHRFDDRLIDYLPPAMVIRLDSIDFPAGSTLIAFSPLLLKTPLPLAGAATYAEWTQEALRTRMVWKALLEGASGAHPRCPHGACTYHRSGLCHGWFPIPTELQNCSFPEFWTLATKHRLSADGAALEPVGTDGMEVNEGDSNGLDN